MSDCTLIIAETLGRLSIIIFTAPLFLIFILPLGVLYYFIQQFYRCTARELTRYIQLPFRARTKSCVCVLRLLYFILQIRFYRKFSNLCARHRNRRRGKRYPSLSYARLADKVYHQNKNIFYISLACSHCVNSRQNEEKVDAHAQINYPLMMTGHWMGIW